MALSNWAHMAMDGEGKPIEAIFTSPTGVKVKIYKNWVYIEDEKAWREGAYVHPTIMQVYSGSFYYRDTEFHAETIKNTIYVHVSSYVKGKYSMMSGIGTMHERTLISRDKFNTLVRFLRRLSNEEYVTTYYQNLKFENIRPYNQGDAFFVGVKNAMSRAGQKTILEQALTVTFKKKKKR